jgi:pimeloyl-ACP methyl ester carboxylesterase
VTVGRRHWRCRECPLERCADIEFPAPEFRVTADGVAASQFELDRVINPGSTCTNELKNPRPFFIDENREKIISPERKKFGAIKVTAQDEHGLYFEYTHPTDLPPDGDVSRDVTIGIEYERESGGHVIWNSMVIHVYRPPVVMTHGLWADAESFAKMEKNFSSVSHDYPPDLLYRVDYSKDHANAKSFVENLAVAENGVAALLEQAAKKDFAIGKVDLVGHSMGGILSRLYVQGQYYGDDVRRIVTCNTPHAGSQMANWLLDEVWDPYGLACAAIGATTGSCYEGAVLQRRQVGVLRDGEPRARTAAGELDDGAGNDADDQHAGTGLDAGRRPVVLGNSRRRRGCRDDRAAAQQPR